MVKPLALLGVALATALLTSSCARFRAEHVVGVREPVGQDALSEDSVWQLGDQVYHLRVVDSNTLVAASVTWDSSARAHTLASYPLVCSKLGEHLFLNVMDEGRYTILRMIPAENEMVLLTVDSEKIDKDIAAGKLKARRDGHDFLTACTKEELDQYVLENLPTLFSLDGAAVARLVSGKLKK